MNDKEKTFLLHLALVAFESVRADEEPKTARFTRMDRGIDRLLELIDIYRPHAWPNELINRAALMVDSFNARIRREFGDSRETPLVGRDDRGRFTKLGNI